MKKPHLGDSRLKEMRLTNVLPISRVLRPLSRQELSTSPRGSEHNDGGHLLPLVCHPGSLRWNGKIWKVSNPPIRLWIFYLLLILLEENIENLVLWDQFDPMSSWKDSHLGTGGVGPFDSLGIKYRYVKHCYPMSIGQVFWRICYLPPSRRTTAPSCAVAALLMACIQLYPHYLQRSSFHVPQTCPRNLVVTGSDPAASFVSFYAFLLITSCF